MTRSQPDDRLSATAPRTTEDEWTARAIVIVAASIAGLTFLFGFGNCWSLGIRLGAPTLVAPLVGPAVDFSVVGLLVARRFLGVHGAPCEELVAVRRLLVASCIATLALNVAQPIIAGQLGKAGFDAVAPLLLMGWAETGPRLLEAIHHIREREQILAVEPIAEAAAVPKPVSNADITEPLDGSTPHGIPYRGDLIEQARQANDLHWAQYRRPISADTLRQRLHVSSHRARLLVRSIRNTTAHDQATHQSSTPEHCLKTEGKATGAIALA